MCRIPPVHTGWYSLGDALRLIGREGHREGALSYFHKLGVDGDFSHGQITSFSAS